MCVWYCGGPFWEVSHFDRLVLVLGLRLPICQPHDRKTLTTFGVTAAVSGTRIKMKLLWMAYASASWVARPGGLRQSRTLNSEPRVSWRHIGVKTQF